MTYRSPYWDFSPNTIRILEENGFLYDSSLMGNDLHPYYPRPVTPHSDRANEFGEPSKILELPCPGSWTISRRPNISPADRRAQRPAQDIFDRWASIFDYACTLDGALLHSDHPPADHWPGPHDPDVREADQLHGRAGRLVRHSG